MDSGDAPSYISFVPKHRFHSFSQNSLQHFFNLKIKTNLDMENFTEKTLYCSPQLRELDVDNIVNGEGRESNPMTGLTSEFENKAYSVNEDILKGDGESGIGGE